MISIIEFKKYIASINIFSIIINKFCYEKKLCLVILFKINKNLKKDFYYIILFFNLIIYLQIKDDKKFLFDAKKIVQ